MRSRVSTLLVPPVLKCVCMLPPQPCRERPSVVRARGRLAADNDAVDRLPHRCQVLLSIEDFSTASDLDDETRATVNRLSSHNRPDVCPSAGRTIVAIGPFVADLPCRRRRITLRFRSGTDNSRAARGGDRRWCNHGDVRARRERITLKPRTEATSAK